MGRTEYELFIRQKMEELSKLAGYASWPSSQASRAPHIQVFPTRPTIGVTPKYRDEDNLLSHLGLLDPPFI